MEASKNLDREFVQALSHVDFWNSNGPSEESLLEQTFVAFEKWLNLKIVLLDGNARIGGSDEGTFFKPCNRSCAFIVSTPTGIAHCKKSVAHSLELLKSLKNSYSSSCHAGFSTLIVPLTEGENFYGALYVDGFYLEKSVTTQKKANSAYISEKFPNAPSSFDQTLTEIPIMNESLFGYVKATLENLSSHIVKLRRSIYETKKTILTHSTRAETEYFNSGLIAQSEAMKKVLFLAKQIASSEAPVRITGENGTGKEVLAHFIHNNSSRCNNAFVVQNCGAISDSLLESELFGHVKGAFTGAYKDKKGLFEIADNGTLFLDEIGDTSTTMQVKLLRVLQEGTFIPVGGTEQKLVNVRIVSATNKSLEKLVAEGSFREDLYYRINVLSLSLPPLRDRKEDIPSLLLKFISDIMIQNPEQKKILTPQALEVLESYSWPGNIRELKNEVHRFCVLSGQNSEISVEILSESVKKNTHRLDKKQQIQGKFKDHLEQFEKNLLLQVLEQEHWNKSKVAILLEMSRATIISKCQKYGIECEPTAD